ncbi:YqhR family membrane protein [Paenibacillus sp. CAA11]|uniref:YqhR family membrane protein n=1 Tax=Paenibacillus sp. CAA11 TaxID=1532905 RepID=UPI001F47ACAC|nr:YqhR family membrane protein [Paenibacillus sp. CAA11]
MAEEHTTDSEIKTNPIRFAIRLGFFAGLIWGAVHGFFYYMRFTVVIPGFLAEPFFKHSFLVTRPGYYVGWLVFILFSIVASLLYTLVLRKVKGPWMGMFYGLLWFVLIYALLSPALHMAPLLFKMGWNSLISEVCLFLLWGLFIGYTVATEYNDERFREPKKALA